MRTIHGLCLVRCCRADESIAVRCYNILFCLLIVFAELECTQSIREMSVLHSWVTRGILYSL